LQWINEKKQAKINKMQVREKMVKLLINSSFGLYGQSSNPLFSPNIGPAITAAGR
jgi:DNA polymerase elongation subunit (family B)